MSTDAGASRLTVNAPELSLSSRTDILDASASFDAANLSSHILTSVISAITRFDDTARRISSSAPSSIFE